MTAPVLTASNSTVRNAGPHQLSSRAVCQQSSPATPAALAPSVLAAALQQARGACWQRWPGHHQSVNRAVLAWQLKLDRTSERLFLKPVERAVLASILSTTNRAPADTTIQMETACNAVLAQKLQRQKDEREFTSESAKWSQLKSTFHQNQELR